MTVKHKLVEWRAGSAGTRLMGSICPRSCCGKTKRKTGSTTGCNTRHERGGEAGPMSCVAAPGPANRSPSAQAGNSWSTVKRKTGKHRGRKWGREGRSGRKRDTVNYNRFCVWERGGADGRKWEESDRVVGLEMGVGGGKWTGRVIEWREILMESEWERERERQKGDAPTQTPHLSPGRWK